MDAQQPWDSFIPLVYSELRAMAHRQLRRERDDHTLSTTGLVHETYLKLVDQQHVDWRDRSHFFALAATIMRRVLIDYARRHHRAKRGDGCERLPIDEGEMLADERADSLVALDEALTRLSAFDERLVRVVECRFFGGLTEEETGLALGVTARTVRRDWMKAKAWLERTLEN